MIITFKFEKNLKQKKCFNFLKMCNFSLVARYYLKFTSCWLLVVKSLVARSKICFLRVVEVAHCKKSRVICCKIRLLLVAKFHSLLVSNSLLARCWSCSLHKITCYSLQDLLVSRCRSCLLQKITRYSLWSLLFCDFGDAAFVVLFMSNEQILQRVTSDFLQRATSATSNEQVLPRAMTDFTRSNEQWMNFNK